MILRPVRLKLRVVSLPNPLRSGQNGQTLLEVLVALGVGIFILTAMTSAILGSLANAQFSKNQNLATLYAQQGMEIVRDIRNTDWSNFYNTYTSASPTTFCLPKGGTSPNSGSCLPADYIDGFFKREIKFARDALDPINKIQVTATVSFTDSKGEHKSELVSVFTNWNVQ